MIVLTRERERERERVNGGYDGQTRKTSDPRTHFVFAVRRPNPLRRLEGHFG
jgi:hypothetical protein